MNSKISRLLLAFVVFTSVVLASFAAESFTLTAASDSLNANVGDNVQFSITVENTGNATINITLDSSVSLTSGGNSVTFSPSATTITNLAQGATQVITLDSDSEFTTSGTFSGSLSGEVSDNSSATALEGLSVTVPEPTDVVFFEGFEDGDIRFEVDLDDDDDTQRLRMVNGFNQDITDIILTLVSDIDDFEVETNIEFEETGDDKLDVDEDDKDEEFELSSGSTYSFTLDLRNLDDIAIKTHSQSNALEVDYILANGSSRTQSFDMTIIADKDDVDIEFRQTEFEITIDRGESDDFDLEIRNNEDFELENITISIGDDFELTSDSSEELSSSRIEFEETGEFTVDEGTQDFRIDINSNDNDEVGTYEGTFVLEYQGDEIDEIPVTIKITDGVFIKSITPEGPAIPDENLQIDVLIDNQDSTQSITVTGRIENVNTFGTDLVETENIVIAKNNEEIIELIFSIPDDVRSNDLLLELTVEYTDPDDDDKTVEFIEEVALSVDRPDNAIDIVSAFVSPNVISCESGVQAKVTFKNVGSQEEDVTVSANVGGTSISSERREFDLVENGQDSFTYIVPTSTLAPGQYGVEFRLEYDNGQLVETRTVNFEKFECSTSTSGGVQPSNPTNSNVDANGNIVLSGSTGGSGSGSTNSGTIDTGSTSGDSFFDGVDVLTLVLIGIVGMLIIIVVIILIFVL